MVRFSKIRKNSKEPGPGDFHGQAWPEPLATSNENTSTSYSIPLKRRLSSDADRKAFAPGVGSFSPSESLIQEKSASWSFGSEIRFRGSKSSTLNASLTLGPNSGRSKSKWGLPQCSFGTARRFPKDAKTSYWSVHPTPPAGVGVPGPGQHRPEDRSTSKWTSSPSFSNASRYPVADRNKDPGPGEYEVSKSVEATREAAPGVGVTTAKRNFQPGPSPFMRRTPGTSPGPAAYAPIGHDRKGGKTFGATKTGHLFASARRKLTFSTLH